MNQKIFLWPQTWLFQALRMSKAQIVRGFEDFRNYDNYLGFNPESSSMLKELGQSFGPDVNPMDFPTIKKTGFQRNT